MAGTTPFAAFSLCRDGRLCDGRMIPMVVRRIHPEPETAFAGNLLAQAQLIDNRFVTFGIVSLEVVEQATTLADQHEKTAA